MAVLNHSGFASLQFSFSTMVENVKKHRQISHLIIHFPTSEGVSEVSERANEWAQQRARAKRAVRSKQTSEYFNEWILQSVFLAVFDHSEMERKNRRETIYFFLIFLKLRKCTLCLALFFLSLVRPSLFRLHFSLSPVYYLSLSSLFFFSPCFFSLTRSPLIQSRSLADISCTYILQWSLSLNRLRAKREWTEKTLWSKWKSIMIAFSDPIMRGQGW